jgi:hypothetical protein
MSEPTMKSPKRWPWEYPEAVLCIIGGVTAVVAIVLSIISIITVWS